jgi:signal transduction histidine kinase
LTPFIGLEIHKEAFDRVLKNSSSISLAMVREISRRLRENDEMAIDDLRMRATELAEAYQKLAEQQVARRDFLTNISHQLRTPLMAAGGYLQMLQKGAIPPEKTPAAMETVNNNVQQITGLVNDILFVQEMDLILDQFKPVNLVTLVRQVVSNQTEKVQARKIELSVKPDMFLPPIMGDQQSLERAFTALLDNSIKFSPDGGKIEIRLRRKGSQIAIEIIDQGIGISPEQLPHIFERFYHMDKSGDKLYEGLGLGLAITKQVIEQHKGHLDVISTPGKGSTFTMWLNVWDENGKPGKKTGTTL